MAGIISLVNDKNNDEVFYQYDRGRIINIDISALNDVEAVDSKGNTIGLATAEQDRVKLARVEYAPVVNNLEKKAFEATLLNSTVNTSGDILYQAIIDQNALLEAGQLNIYVLVTKESFTDEEQNGNLYSPNEPPTWVIEKKTYEIKPRSIPDSLLKDINIEASNPIYNTTILDSLDATRKYSYRGMTSGIFPLTEEGQSQNWHENDILLDINTNHLYVYINVLKETNGISTTEKRWVDIGDMWYGDRQGNLVFYTGKMWITTPFIYSAEQAEDLVQEIYSYEGTVADLNKLNEMSEKFVKSYDSSDDCNTIHGDNNTGLFLNLTAEEHARTHLGDTYAVANESYSLYVWSRFENNFEQNQFEEIMNSAIDQHEVVENGKTYIYTWIQLNRSNNNLSQEFEGFLQTYIDNTVAQIPDNINAEIINGANEGRLPSTKLLNDLIKIINQKKLNSSIFNDFINTNRIRIITIAEDEDIDEAIDNVREAGLYLFTKRISNYINTPQNGKIVIITVKEERIPHTNSSTGYIDNNAIQRTYYQLKFFEKELQIKVMGNTWYKTSPF